MRTLVLLLALASCGSYKNQLHVTKSPTSPSGDLVVAEPMVLGDHVEGDRFRQNTLVGNYSFSGGYVTERDDTGMYNHSKEVVQGDGEAYRGHVRDWLATTLPAQAQVRRAPPPPRASPERGTSRHDGRDNQSLPRLRYTPVPGGSFAEPTVVPWVISYYSHNGGWFYGQEYGSGAGARVRVLLAAYDTDGTVLGWIDVDGSRVAMRMFSPTGPQLQDMLIKLERRVGRKLRRGP